MAFARTRSTTLVAAGAALFVLAACGAEETAEAPAPEMAQAEQPAMDAPAADADGPARVDHGRIMAAEAGAEPDQWLTVGRTYSEQRFSPLDAIDTENVSELGLAWYADVDSNRGQEATPLFIDGVLYVTAAWSHVYAYDAESGALLWHYDPEVPGEWGGKGCCDVVNRGVAAWNGKIYVAAYDGRLIALDAATGAEVWSIVTVDQDQPYSITGAPRIADGLVVIGNAGAEFSVRGYISAYDAETGDMVWRWHTVPGNPADGFENPQMEMAAETWSGDWWTVGGGGTVWDGILYDPETGMVYFGTGNGTPWVDELRDPSGGDNLFTGAVVALDAATGEYRWHFQETPRDSWDFDSDAPLMTADLMIDGQERHVLMHPVKNGFFYVYDAATGEVISAQNFVPVTWSTGYDPETNRMQVVPEARFGETGEAFVVAPGGAGAHAWHPFSYSPLTGLVYLPASENAGAYAANENYEPRPGQANTGTGGPIPPDLYDRTAPDIVRGGSARLLAWDPVAQEEVWRTESKGGINSGAMATAGGLVFHGSSELDGFLAAYDASTGEELWRMNTEAGVVAAPSSFAIDGEQYIAQLVGYGVPGYGNSNGSRLLVFKLGGTAELPPAPEPVVRELNPPEQFASAQTIDHGAALFQDNCAMCHESSYGNRGLFPDLRYSPRLNSDSAFQAVVLGGALQENGMRSFAEVLDAEDAEAIRAHLVARAHQAMPQQ